MALIKKIGRIILDIFEIYIPVTTFTIMFSVFIIQIFFRYVLRNPLTWPYELTLLAFLATAFLGACYAFRKNDHVEFTLVYEKCSPKLKVFFRLFGNLLIITAFSIALKPVYDFIQFMSYRRTGVLRIPFSIGFFPFFIMMVLILGHCIYNFITDVRILVKGTWKEKIQEVPHDTEIL